MHRSKGNVYQIALVRVFSAALICNCKKKGNLIMEIKSITGLVGFFYVHPRTLKENYELRFLYDDRLPSSTRT